MLNSALTSAGIMGSKPIVCEEIMKEVTEHFQYQYIKGYKKWYSTVRLITLKLAKIIKI